MHLPTLISRSLGLVIAVTVIKGASGSLAFATSDDAAWGGRTNDDSVSAGASRQWGSAPESERGQASGVPATQRVRQVICQDWIVAGGGSERQRSFVFEGQIPACVEPFVIRGDFCPDGAEPLAPLWESVLVDAEGPTYGPWQTLTGYQCPRDPLAVAAESAWRQMTITPQTVAVLPDQPWAITTVGVAANLDDSAQTTTVTVLGTDVVLRATPISNEWTVTDIVTGDSWPGVFDTASQGGHNVMVFERRQQRVHLGVTTTWEGHYSLNGGTTWVPAPGTATTTSDPLSMHVYHPRARLVNCDTTGDCMGGGVSSNPFTLTDPDADGIDNYLIPDHKISDYLNARADDRRWRDSERVNES